MTGLVPYKDIENKSVTDAVAHIMQASKLKYGELTLDQLLRSGNLSTLKIIEMSSQQRFGYGVYVIFEKGQPKYVGKVVKHFLHRFQSHQHFDPRPEWAWNKLIRKIALERKIHMHGQQFTKPFFDDAMKVLNTFDVVRIDGTDDITTKQCDRLEKILMKGFEQVNPKLYNDTPKTVRGFDSKRKVVELMNL